MGTKAGDTIARTATNGGYERLRVATIQHAMIDQLAHPPPGFEVRPASPSPINPSLRSLCDSSAIDDLQDAVTTHFKLKKDYIRRTVQAWLDEARQHSASSLSSHYRQLKRQVCFVAWHGWFGTWLHENVTTRWTSWRRN